MRAEQRLHDLDNLRTALVMLVVLHHLALIYGAASPFYYVEPPLDDPFAFRALLVFVLVNQGWFMGALFLIAGVFTPAAFDRKGWRAFLRDRIVRLGVPAVAFLLVLGPLSMVGLYLMPASLTGLSWPPRPTVLFGDLGLGPAWFVVMLLGFSLAYAAWRGIAGARPTGPTVSRGLPGPGAVAVFVLALAVTSYLVRVAVPLGREVTLVFRFLDFPTLAYLPQYAAFFAVGTVAGRNGWRDRLTGRMGVAGFAAALAATVLLFPLAIGGAPFSLDFGEAVLGGGSWQSAVYALWDSIMAVGLTVASVVAFRTWGAGGGPLATFLARQSYAVFLLHIPVVILVAFLLRNTGLPTLGRFALSALVGVPLCFAVAWIVRRVPGVGRVL